MLSSWVPPSTVYVYPMASWFTEQHEYVVPFVIEKELPSPQACAVFISPTSMKTNRVLTNTNIVKEYRVLHSR